jgi:hypothetical protein
LGGARGREVSAVELVVVSVLARRCDWEMLEEVVVVVVDDVDDECVLCCDCRCEGVV